MKLLGYVTVGLVVLAAWLVATTYERGCHEIHTYGTVTSFDITDDDDGEMYTAIVELDAGGQHVTIRGPTTSPPLFDRGEIVPVLYDPVDPQDAELDTYLTRWFWSIAAIVAAIAAAIGWRCRIGGTSTSVPDSRTDARCARQPSISRSPNEFVS